ncbi:MAG: GumC family protein [Flavobacteriaceae bacterium]
MSPQSSAETENNSIFNIKYEFFKYLNYWPWFILSVILLLTVSFLYLRYTPKVYNTNAKIKILDENSGLELPTSALIVNRSNINLENENEILRSYPILSRVVDQLDLCAQFYEKGRVKSKPLVEIPFNFELTRSLDSITEFSQYSVFVEESGFKITNENTDLELSFSEFDTTKSDHQLPFELKWSSEFTKHQLMGRNFDIQLIPKKFVVLNLKSKIEIEPIGEKSDLLSLNMKGENSLISEQILNTLIDVFNQDDILDRQLIWKRTIDFVDERFVNLSQELDSIESYKKNFKINNNLVDISTDGIESLEQRSKSDEKLFHVENQIVVSNLIKNSLLNSSQPFILLPSNIGVENLSINSLLDEYNTLVLQRQKLISSAGANNPTVILLEENLRDLNTNIENSISAYLNQLNLTKNQLTSRNQMFQSKVSAIPKIEQQLRAIERQQEIKERLFIFLLQKKEEASVNLAVTEPTLKVVEYSISDIRPISPKPTIIYLGAFIVGLLLPFGILYIVFLLDTKIHNKLDMDVLASEIPIIAEIPLINEGINTVFSNPNDRSALAESFRILTTNIDFILSSKKSGKVIFCTSTIKGEGKTFISLNFSLAMASLNNKVLLIGADLRNPQLHTYAKVNKNRPGLSNYLVDPSIDLSSLIINVFEKQPNHEVLFSGTIPPNPAHLLANGNFETLIEEAKSRYDYIVVDLAPTILVTDTLLVAHHANATICAVRANHTDKKLIPFSENLSKTNRLKNMVYVINGVKENRSYGYSYNYGYNYGYGGEDS